jgi:very-short-patch-repair endonuclease
MKHRTVGAPDQVVKRARKLRKEMSLPEVLLWQQLRMRPSGFKFRRQYPHEIGVLDFACLQARLNIEVDGEAHERGDQPHYDKKRDRALLERGFVTLRIPAKEVLTNLEGVVSGIVEQCRVRGPLYHAALRRGPPPRSGEDLR